MKRSTANRFGLHLELRGPGWEKRLTLLGLTDEIRLDLEREFGSRLVTIGVPRRTVIAALGPPDVNARDACRYDLGVREGYLFEFRWSEADATLAGSGYVCAQNRKVEVGLLSSEADCRDAKQYLKGIGASEPEIIGALGEPTERDGWWPNETWSYAPSLALELRLGIVEG